MVPRFLAVPGVADAELRGGALPLLRVLLDLEAMERYGLTADADRRSPERAGCRGARRHGAPLAAGAARSPSTTR